MRPPPRAADGALALTEAELVAWGERFGSVAQAPLAVTLSGDLGAGKTTLVRAICRGFGVTEDVTSPTFAIVHEYGGARAPVLHVDLYRLRDASDLVQLGWDELLARRALILIEWPELARDQLPASHVPITLAHLAEDADRRALLAGGHLGATAFGGDEA